MKKRMIVFACILTLLFTASCAQPRKQQPKAIGGVESSIFETADIERVKITADNANVRSGCNSTAPVLQTSSKDNNLDVVSQVADWFAVKLPNNQIGFVSKDQCKPVVAEDKKPEIPQQTAGAAPQAAQGGTTPGGTTPKTPSAKNDKGTLTSQEQEMINLVNQARAQNNVPALTMDMSLTNVARVKAQDMIDNNYFSHNSPKYGSPFDMMKSFGIHYVQAGENIAGNQSVANAHNSLMNSPGHRKNILSPDFTHIGIGIKKGGPYGYMFSQMFVSKPK